MVGLSFGLVCVTAELLTFPQEIVLKLMASPTLQVPTVSFVRTVLAWSKMPFKSGDPSDVVIDTVEIKGGETDPVVSVNSVYVYTCLFTIMAKRG